MSTRERVHLMVDTMTEEQLSALLILFGSFSAVSTEVDPDEWDMEMIKRAESENDGSVTSIDDLAKELGIDYGSI